MSYTPYGVYQVFKSVEADVKKKAPSALTEEQYDKRISDKNKDLHKQVADLFNTKFANINLSEYIKCGFHHFKGFGFDKFFREIVLKEYIARDNRIKRDPNEPLSGVLKSLKHINRTLEGYLIERRGNQKRIVYDYIHNNIGSTIVVYCIWRNLWQPDTIEWEYLNVIKNNWSDFEKSVIKYAPMIDKWRKDIKGKR